MSIKIVDLDKYYGKSRGVVNLNLEVNKGELFGFIGPNGSGKSTTIRVLLNLIWPTRGQAFIFGKNCTRESADIKKVVGYVPSEVNYYPALTTRQTLEYTSKIRHINNSSRIDTLIERLDINPKQRIGDLSLGNKKKVAIAQSLLASPQMLIMDEPTNGLDPLMQNRLEEILIEEHGRGTTIFLSSHNLNEVQRLCQRVAIIKEGSIIEVRTLERMLDQAVRRVRIAGKQLTSAQLSTLHPLDLTASDDSFTFNYQGEVKTLLQVLANLDIEEVSISEPSLEDVFRQYYDKDS